MVKTKTNINVVEEEYFETKILEYQKSIENQNKTLSNELFKKICDIYKPEKYINTWQKQYQYLYDSPEDFRQEYMKIFILTLKKWKPRELRGKSRYNGVGSFKNYFWGSLSHNFINMVKAVEGSAKRNISTRCPECDEWHNPISLHIIKKHESVLWDKLTNDGINIHKIIECPFCQNSIYKGKANLSSNELLKKHILSKHLSMLFDSFSEKYPDFVHYNTKHFSVDIDNEDGSSIYDITPSTQTLISKLTSNNLSDIQKLMIDHILSKPNTAFAYNEKIFKCSEENFHDELEDLKDKINILQDV